LEGCAAAEFASECAICGDGGEDGGEFWREVAGGWEEGVVVFVRVRLQYLTKVNNGIDVAS
jgi:hypothetical protein